MQERLRGYYAKVIEKWNSLTKTQKMRLVITTALLIITLVAFIIITSRPQLTTIVSNRDYTEIAQIKQALESAGISSTEAKDGTALTINKKDRAKALITIATSGSSSSLNNFTYQDALDATTMSTTDKVAQENLRRVYNTDLAQGLETIDGIEQASVTIFLPDSSNFYIESKQKATASVILTLSRSISTSMGERLARYIAASVKGLDLENIEIMSTDLETIYSGSQRGNPASSTDPDIETKRKQEYDRLIRAALSPFILDEVRTVSTIKVNNDKASEVSTLYTNPMGDETQQGLIADEEVKKSTVENGNADSAPGVESNDMTPATYQTGNESQSSATINERKTQYLQNAIQRSVDYAIGDIDQTKSSISIYGYKYKKYDEKYLTDNNLLGGMTWQQFKESKEDQARFALDQDEEYDKLKASLIIGTGIQNLALLIYERPVFYDYVREPFQIQQLIMFGILAFLILLLAYELIRKAQPDEITEVEPELSVEDLLVSTQLEEEKVEEEERLKLLEFGEESPTKVLIEKFVTERPEAVAQLLRNWLNDEWE